MGKYDSMYVTEESKKILWPAQDAQAQIAAATTGSIYGSRILFPPRTKDLKIAIDRQFPATGTWSSKYVKMKIKLSGAAKWKHGVVIVGNKTDEKTGAKTKERPSSNVYVSAKVEKVINDKLAFEASAKIDHNNLKKIGESIKKSDWNGVAKAILSAKFKGKQELSKHTSFKWTLGISAPDSDGCFLSATGKLVMAFETEELIREALGIEDVFPKTELEVGVTISFGLTAEAWQAIAKRIGGQVIRRAIAVVASNAVRVALIELLTVLGIFTVIVVVGVAVPFGSLYLCNQARKDGQQIGVLMRYSRGYLARIAIGNSLSQGTNRNFIENAGAGDINRLGWNDASWAIQKSGHRLVQEKVIYLFGSNWDPSWFSQRPKNVRSRVGKKVDTSSEVNNTAMKMAYQIHQQLDDMIEYAERKHVKGLIGSRKS